MLLSAAANPAVGCTVFPYNVEDGGISPRVSTIHNSVIVPVVPAVVEPVQALVLTLVGSFEPVVGAVVLAFQPLVLALVRPI